MKTLLRLLGFLRPYAGWVALSVLTGTAAVAAGIGLMGTSAFLIARAAQQPSISVLQVAIVGVRFFGLSRAVLRYLERLVSHSVNFRLLAQLRVWFYRAVEPLAPARLVDARSGDLLSRAVSDIDTLENFYVRAVAPPFTALLVTLGVSLFVGRYHPALAALLLAALLLVGVGLPLLAHLLSRAPGQASVAQRASLNAYLVEQVQGAADLAAFGQTEAHLQRALAAGRNLRASQAVLGRVGALANALSVLVSGLAVWGVLAVGVPFTGQRFDGISLAVLVLVVMASFEAVNPLAAAAQQLPSSLAAANRLFQLADEPPAVAAPPAPAASPAASDIRIRGLWFGYRQGEGPVLQDISIDLPPGRHVALVGPSGAGKTTLLHLLLRFWDFSQGEIMMDGRDIREYDPDAVRRHMVMIGQSTYLFAGSLRQNLLLACPQAAPEDLADAVQGAQLTDVIERLPQGLDTWLGERGVLLSGGERQRVALARALLRLNSQPGGILLLDEPSVHLDVENEARFWAALRPAARGRSMLLVTHRLAGLENMDEIVLLRGGRVIERGRHDALLRQGGAFARLWEIHRQALPG